MSREILFKAKRTDNGEWVEGFVARPCKSDAEKNPLTYYFNAVDELGWYTEVIVSAKTVCQCTGKTDVDKNLIFEHDVISFWDTYSTDNGYAEVWCIGEVVWDEETSSFQVTERLSAESYEVLDECKVLGNTIDNPKLLEGGTK